MPAKVKVTYSTKICWGWGISNGLSCKLSEGKTERGLQVPRFEYRKFQLRLAALKPSNRNRKA